MVRMKDVARLAGVSTATVSRVINNSAYVEPVTRERVEKAMREYNYRRNAAALALAKRSGNMLGLLTGNLDDPFFSRMARGVEDVTRQAGVQLMLCSGGHLPEREKDGLDFLINQGCEAIVAHLTRMSDEDILRYAAHTPAMVVLNRYLPVISNRCLWLDNVSAAEAATNLLIQHGHRKIACVTADITIDDREHRMEGYCKAMANAGLRVEKSWIISVPFNEQGGAQAAEKLLHAGHAFTAVVTFNDVMAAGMMRVFHARQVKVPDDISIVGFDDIAWAQHLHPALTTMHYPIEKMARRAATLALQLNSGVVGLPQTHSYLAELVHRASVAVLTYWQGYRWPDIIDSIVSTLAKAMPVMMILICVGGLIGTWMLSGTIPYMVYWGLKLVSPQYIVITTFLITCVISVCTGTSWGTAGTVGVALMGVAAALDVSLAATAGAVVSGAYFGDKISPLSDSTNFAAIVAETNLYSHIRHLMYTTLPSFGLAAVVYLIAGHTTSVHSEENRDKVIEIVTSLESLYHFSLLLLLPPLLVLWGAITKRPVIPVMLSASILAIGIGLSLQGFTLQHGFNSLIHGFTISMFPTQAIDVTNLLTDIPRLLERGGMFSMMGTIFLVFCAFSFAGVLTLTGALTIIITRLLTVIHTVGQLISATVITTLLVTGTTSDGKLALLIPAELFKKAYQFMGLDNKNLSRTVEDAGTVIEPLLPWTAAGVYMASTLGVSTLDFAPWAIQCYAAVFFALIYGFTGWGIARLPTETHRATLTPHGQAN